MCKIVLAENIERLTHVREKLAFLYDSFSQTDSFEFSEMGGNFGITLILEELIGDLREIEGNLSALMKERTPD